MAAKCGRHGYIEVAARPPGVSCPSKFWARSNCQVGCRASRQYQPATCPVYFETESPQGSMSAIELSNSSLTRNSVYCQHGPSSMHPPRTSNFVNRDLCTTGTNYALANEASWRLVSGNEATRWRNFVRPDNKRPEMSALVCSNPKLSASQARNSAPAGQNCLPTNKWGRIHRTRESAVPIPRTLKPGFGPPHISHNVYYVLANSTPTRIYNLLIPST